MIHTYVKDPKFDLNIDIPDIVNDIILDMPSHCQLECCGFICIIWKDDIYEKFRNSNIDKIFLNWANESIGLIKSKEIIRYINSDKWGYFGGDPKFSIEFFNEIIKYIIDNPIKNNAQQGDAPETSAI